MLTENLTGQVQFHIILARCFAVMKAHGLSGLVSFSDPLPRRALDETYRHHLPGIHGGCMLVRPPIWEPRGTRFRPYNLSTLIFFYIGRAFGTLFRCILARNRNTSGAAIAMTVKCI